MRKELNDQKAKRGKPTGGDVGARAGVSVCEVDGIQRVKGGRTAVGKSTHNGSGARSRAWSIRPHKWATGLRQEKLTAAF